MKMPNVFWKRPTVYETTRRFCRFLHVGGQCPPLRGVSKFWKRLPVRGECRFCDRFRILRVPARGHGTPWPYGCIPVGQCGHRPLCRFCTFSDRNHRAVALGVHTQTDACRGPTGRIRWCVSKKRVSALTETLLRITYDTAKQLPPNICRSSTYRTFAVPQLTEHSPFHDFPDIHCPRLVEYSSFRG